MMLPMRSLLLRFLLHPLTRLVLSLVVAGAVLLLLAILASGVRLPMGRPGPPLLSAMLNATATLVALLGVGRYLERRSPAQLGLGLRGAARQLGWGGLLGAGMMGAVVAVLALAGWYQLVDGTPPLPWPRAREALRWLALFSAAGFFEELLFRGILFRLLEEWLGSAVDLVVRGTLLSPRR